MSNHPKEPTSVCPHRPARAFPQQDTRRSKLWLPMCELHDLNEQRVDAAPHQVAMFVVDRMRKRANNVPCVAQPPVSTRMWLEVMLLPSASSLRTLDEKHPPNRMSEFPKIIIENTSLVCHPRGPHRAAISPKSNESHRSRESSSIFSIKKTQFFIDSIHNCIFFVIVSNP